MVSWWRKWIFGFMGYCHTCGREVYLWDFCTVCGGEAFNHPNEETIWFLKGHLIRQDLMRHFVASMVLQSSRAAQRRAEMKSHCPKCGSGNIRTYYCKSGWIWQLKEHLHKHCNQCNYEWTKKF